MEIASGIFEDSEEHKKFLAEGRVVSVVEVFTSAEGEPHNDVTYAGSRISQVEKRMVGTSITVRYVNGKFDKIL